MIVSVVMITYGHEKYIQQAIEGVLSQDCDFEIELIIADDCSPDSTQSVVSEIKENQPKGELIKYFRHERNIGMMSNFIFALQNAQGKYIALCEGDDFWTDKGKLKKQVEILNQNTDCVICFTDNSILTENQKIIPTRVKDVAVKTNFNELIKDNYIATMTVLFRKPNDFDFPDWFVKLKIGDWPLYLHLLKNGGNIFYLKNDTGVYRHGVGVSNEIRKKNSKITLIILEILYKFNQVDGCFVNKEIIKNEIQRRKEQLLTSFIRENEKIEAIRIFAEVVTVKNFFKLSRTICFSIYKKIFK